MACVWRLGSYDTALVEVRGSTGIGVCILLMYLNSQMGEQVTPAPMGS